ncbi:alpha-mannosidase [Turicibacter sanguinis]|uniref:alpha-mannosidase n=1 Tax=Turicibacter sanguinis TaxID=154288 RepID=UPI0018AA6170|nr:alpha-mannosidase [Turicibacter sanguinis]MDB8558128.1 alpha-mannosidase [Turicibacter sanguinis]MDB8560903.1 alpha-mannosidase [Turicibacter sanguinis]
MKTAHIISHSHWDREWYLPYEKHHMLLIEFMDTLINTLETDPDYKSFHLDGQTLLIEDYLQVRPENKEHLKKLIEAKRIHVGPWFILQDEFLTSSEANIRNLQMGHDLAREYGEVCKVGYFPDSFGNMGQAPQILKKAGIETAVFGRGVKPTGFNNEVSDNDAYESPYSEMYWESEDGSKVLAILFANWYSNGLEVPVDKEEAKKYWEKKLADATKYASTPHLLFMNGCDHQPVQTDLSQAIKTAQELYPDVEFKHSNFEEYIEALHEKLADDMTTITGELRSQQTDGWYTLANTASARIYIKQMNAKCQMMLEKMAEPLATIAHKEGKPYPHHLFKYAWKLLMENHPHDSICGCSVDEVHREMVTRFEKVQSVAKHIIDESMDYLVSQINTMAFKKENQEVKPFVIANTSGWNRSGVVETELEVAKMYFSEGPVVEVVKQMHERQLPTYEVVDVHGNKIPATIEVLPNAFNYDLPKDRFRQPYIAKRVKVTLEVQEIPAFGYESFALVETKEVKEGESSLIQENLTVETPFMTVHFNENGSLRIFDKATEKTYDNFGIFEDCGDIGNEYIHFMPKDDTPITTRESVANIEVVEDQSYRTVVKVSHTLMIPSKANEILDQEIQDLVEFKYRKASRGEELIPFEIETLYTIERQNRVIKAVTKFNNQALDHRLRVLFETNIDTPYHYADSIFEVAKRETFPHAVWENPCNAQHQQAFINVHDETAGVTIANKGLNEYEVLGQQSNTIAVTLHRGVRELGDWGVFLTPDAQCLGEHEVEFAIILHGDAKSRYQSYTEAYQYQVDWLSAGLPVQEGALSSTYQFLKGEYLEVVPSALKVSTSNNELITRWYNVSNEEAMLKLETEDTLYKTDLLEEEHLEKTTSEMKLHKKEILTLAHLS